ncbi:Uncharacterised protein [Mycobacteroides abscessus subsp. abscessus]|nr:Uncharacterised protein [Mycobacteroides abscessus subsp. abscessus]
MRRPSGSSSGTPASLASTLSCWETAEGVMDSAAAVAAMVPRSAKARSTRRRSRDIDGPAIAHLTIV